MPNPYLALATRCGTACVFQERSLEMHRDYHTLVVGRCALAIAGRVENLITSGRSLAALTEDRAIVWNMRALTHLEVAVPPGALVEFDGEDRFIVESGLTPSVYTFNGAHWLNTTPGLAQSPSMQALNDLGIEPIKVRRAHGWTVAQGAGERIVSVDTTDRKGIDLTPPPGTEQSFSIVGDKILVGTATAADLRERRSVWTLEGEKLCDLEHGMHPMRAGAVSFAKNNQVIVYPYHSMSKPHQTWLKPSFHEPLVGTEYIYLFPDELTAEPFEVDFGEA